MNFNFIYNKQHFKYFIYFYEYNTKIYFNHYHFIQVRPKMRHSYERIWLANSVIRKKFLNQTSFINRTLIDFSFIFIFLTFFICWTNSSTLQMKLDANINKKKHLFKIGFLLLKKNLISCLNNVWITVIILISVFYFINKNINSCQKIIFTRSFLFLLLSSFPILTKGIFTFKKLIHASLFSLYMLGFILISYFNK